MALGTIIFDGTLKLDISSIAMKDGTILLSAVATLPRKKDIPHGKGEVPYVIYGPDESIIAVGICVASQFNEAHKYIRGGNLYLTQPIKITTELRPCG